MKLLLIPVLVLSWVAAPGLVARSQGSFLEEEQPDKEAAGPDKEADKPEEEVKKEEKEDTFLAVTGGDVYTVTGGVLRGATVLCKNDKIERIGYGVTIPERAARLDATGLRVYPGLIACDSSGIVGSEPVDLNTDVFALNLTIALGSGLTTVISGETAAKLTYGTLEGIVLRANLFTNLRLGSGEQRRKLREEFQKIRDFHHELEEYNRRKAEGEEGLEEPKPKGLNSGYRALLEGDAVAKVQANSANDLRVLCRFIQDFGFRAVVYGAIEGWVVADELGRSGVSCVVVPRQVRSVDRSRNQPNGSRVENAAMLYDRGVSVAVIPSSTGISLSGLAGRDLMTLPMEAAFAVRGGLPRQAALEAITIGAARILGIDDRVGSLAAGKDADLIVTDGDILHYQTMVYYTVVNGRLVYDKEKESLFAHIRPLEGSSRYELPPEIIEDLEKAHPPEEEKKEDEPGEPEKGEGEGDGEGDPPPDDGEGS